jgi:hypothetical protein
MAGDGPTTIANASLSVSLLRKIGKGGLEAQRGVELPLRVCNCRQNPDKGQILTAALMSKRSAWARDTTVNNFNRPMTRLLDMARPPFGCRPKDHWLVASRWSRGRHNTRPDFEPKVRGLGSQRVPLSALMNANGGPMLVINGGSKTV